MSLNLEASASFKVPTPVGSASFMFLTYLFNFGGGTIN